MNIKVLVKTSTVFIISFWTWERHLCFHLESLVNAGACWSEHSTARWCCYSISVPESPGQTSRPPGAGGPRLQEGVSAAAPPEDTGSSWAEPGRPAPRSASLAPHHPEAHPGSETNTCIHKYSAAFVYSLSEYFWQIDSILVLPQSTYDIMCSFLTGITSATG